MNDPLDLSRDQSVDARIDRRVISFFVSGIPQTAGSKRAFAIRKAGVFTGRIAVSDANPKGREWKNLVADAGTQAMIKADVAGLNCELLTGPLKVTFSFTMPRLKGHYRSNGQIKPNAPIFPICRPDVLKLARCAEDALTGIIWRDDSQIVQEILHKVYGDRPGATITITPL